MTVYKHFLVYEKKKLFIKKKPFKLGFVKIQTSIHWKTLLNYKREAVDWNKIFTRRKFDKVLVSKTDKELFWLRKMANNPTNGQKILNWFYT